MPARLQIKNLVASRAVVDKLQRKHGVTFDEAQSVVFSGEVQIRRGRAGLYLLYGRTDAGRYLLVVIGISRQEARIVTARDMTPKERRFYGRQRRR